MKTDTQKLLIYASYTAVLMVCCLLYWLVCHPELLSYQEQYQLFLFTSDYFGERIALPGGLADYVSEFIVQFYYVPWAGAALIALLMTLIQVVLAACSFEAGVPKPQRPTLYALASVPSVLLTYWMGDVNLLLSYPVALLLVLLMLYLTLKTDVKSHTALAVVLIIGFAVSYWAAGAVALLYPLLVALLRKGLKYRWIWALASIAVACLMIYAVNRLYFTQYPESQMYYGINYYRPTNVHPSAVFIIAASVAAVGLIAMVASGTRAKWPVAIGYGAMGAVAIFAVVFVPKGYDAGVTETLRYDMLVRGEKWHDIIDMAGKQKPNSDFSLQALNLALAKTGQLGERMFAYPQRGIGSLFARYQRDNTTCLITAETFYHLGMINSAFRYNFDLQEAIMNDRKSGRFMRRMAECMIINGMYPVAEKYLDMLSHSLFYSDWAKEAMTYLADEERINAHPQWGDKRRLRFRQDFLYDYNEIDKVLARLAIESGGLNRLAWDYFNAAVLLNGNLPLMTGMYHYANELFRVADPPRHHQEAIAMYWTFGHPDFEGIPYKVDGATQQRLASFVRTFSQNQGASTHWQAPFADTYWTYYLNNQQNSTATSERGSEREG